VDQEEDEQQGIKTRSMVRSKEEEELEKQFKGIKTKGKIRALEEEIKRIRQLKLFKVERT